jgi:hypothetical protein
VRLFANIRAVTEAGLTVQGIHPVSVVYRPSSDRTLPRLAAECGTLAGQRGAKFTFAEPPGS